MVNVWHNQCMMYAAVLSLEKAVLACNISRGLSCIWNIAAQHCARVDACRETAARSEKVMASCTSRVLPAACILNELVLIFIACW